MGERERERERTKRKRGRKVGNGEREKERERARQWREGGKQGRKIIPLATMSFAATPWPRIPSISSNR